MPKPDARVAVIGAGMSGILAGIRLQRAGLDFTVYEKADRLGGTWRENTYPGLTCDVPSHVYSYSFDQNPDWSHRFSPGPEIQRYFEAAAEKFGVAGKIRYGREVTRCEWRDGRWQIGFDHGGSEIADFVIAATGFLHHPNVPDFPGLDDFAGAAFHSARWDHSVPIEGKRVGVVGTGSTAIQIVTAITDRTSQLALFQRTAQWIMPGQNPAYTLEERQGWRDDPASLQTLRRDLEAAFSGAFSDALVDQDSDVLRMIEDTCRQHLEERVADPELRERLRPDYRAACKRLVIADGFYEAIQRPHATLVTDPIERIEPLGVRTRDGTLHELDVLVLATGFRAHDFMRPMQVVGRDGVTLDDVWKPTPRAYRSVSVPGFPNLFMIVGPHSPIGNFSLIEISELQVDYVLQLIDRVRDGACREIAASAEAMEGFNASLQQAMKNTVWVTGCRSWYLDANGVPATWPWTVQHFRDVMQKPDFADFEEVA